MDKLTNNQIDLNLLDKLSPEEKALALSILEEYSKTGKSDKLDSLILEEYDEIPVSIEQFLEDDDYLGKGLHLVDEYTGERKQTVFPYWIETAKKLFPTNVDTAYNTLILSGAIGLGKSFFAVICMLYLLYRMLCLKDPYKHYGLQPIDHITFSIMNITLDAAKGVAWSKLQELVQLSPWFMSHGTVSRSQNPEWQPEKNIELIYGSQPRHVIGRAVFCLSGDTEIITSEGVIKIEDLVGKDSKVYSADESFNIKLSENCRSQLMKTTNDYYEITLEDDTVVRCTPEHRFMLKDGTYKEAQYLSEDDEIFDTKPFGYVYKITNLVNSKIYIGKREKPTFDHDYWGSGTLVKEAIKKYGKNNFKREILGFAFDRESLCNLEQEWTDFYGLPNLEIGYNLKRGGMKGSSGSHHTDEWKRKHSKEGNARYHKPVSEETRSKISKAKKGKGKGVKNPAKGRPGKKKPEGFGEKVRKTLLGRHLSAETKLKIGEAIKGSRWINNGVINSKLSPGQELPEGFQLGQLVTEEHHDKVSSKLKGRKGLAGDKNPMYGKKHSLESKAKMKENRKNKTALAKNPKAKKVMCLETGDIYGCIKEAEIATGDKYIGSCCKGIIKKCKPSGHRWRYYNEN